MNRLIALAGLPGSGKSTIAHALAQHIGAIWLRVDSMDAAIWRSGTVPKDLRDWTYRAAQAVALDNLRLGHEVIADCVNGGTIARDGWQQVGKEAGVPVVWLEVTCSDAGEHCRRVEDRGNMLPGLTPPRWEDVIALDYQSWDRPHRIIDTAGRDVEDCVEDVLAALETCG